jgi:hypothetical protein
VRRREFITLLGGAAAAWPLAARAQQSKIWRIVQVLPLDAMGHLAKALEQRLANLGYVQGRNITLTNLVVPPQAQAIEGGIRSLLPDADLLVVWSTIGSVVAKIPAFQDRVRGELGLPRFPVYAMRHRRAANACSTSHLLPVLYTNAPNPVMARPPTSALISRVPS